MKIWIFLLGFLMFLPILSIAQLTINLPYGNTYGRNESVYINGTTTPNTMVYLYFYNSSLSLDSAKLWDSTLSDSNGNYNFTWYNSTVGNFTLYVNTTFYSNSTNVSIINPIDIDNLSPTLWYYDRKERYQNFYTEVLNITAKRPIINISFTTNQPSGYTQPFYISEAYGTYHNCSNLDVNSVCYMTYRYANFPYSTSGRTISNDYTLFYENGNFYEGRYSYKLYFKELVKNTTNYLIYSADNLFIGNGTKSGDYCCVSKCSPGGGSDFWREYLSNHGYPYSFNLTLNTTIAFIKVVNDFNAVDTHVEGEMQVRLYIDGELASPLIKSDYDSEFIGDCHKAQGSAWYMIVGKGTHNLTFELASGFGQIVTGDGDYPAPHSVGDWMIDYYVDVAIYAFNDTNYELVLFNGSFSESGMQKLFSVEDKYDIAENSYIFYTTSPDEFWDGVRYYHYLNDNLIRSWGIADVFVSEKATYAIDFSFIQSNLISGTNNLTIRLYNYDDETYERFDIHSGFIYLPKNDFKIEYINTTLNDLPNLKEVSLPILWLGKRQNITFKITNLAPYNLTPTFYLIGPKFILTTPKTLSFQPYETKYVTFNVTVLDIEPARGFGLDTIFIIANSTDGVFAFNYTNIRVLPLKRANVSVSVPPQVQAGGLFSIYTTFSPLNYSLFYPHIMLDLSGTFGFEVGVSSANIGESYTSGRCFDVTIWSSMYEPGVTLAYTTTTSGTFFTIDSLRMVPQHRFYIYDKYGFLNEPKGNESYTLGKILVGYGVLEPGDWDMYGSYDFMVNGFSAETGVIFSDWNLGHQYLYKFLDITEVPQSLNIISGPDQPLPTQLFNWIGFYPRNFPIFIYQSDSNLYVRNFPTDPTTYWIPCMSAGYAPIVPPFNLYIEYIKEGTNAFTIPAGQRLAVIDNQWVEPGEWAEGITFKALAPLDPGVYNITVIVWDDAETGLYWTKTVQIQVVSTIPSPGIVVREEDYAIETVKAVEVGQANWITMKREVWVRNENPYRVALAVWYASPLPEDAIYLNGALSGTITDLASEAEVNPSNITYKVPGVSAWVDKYIYAIGEPQTTKKLIYLRLKIFNNATKTPQYNIIVNRSEFVPTGFEPAEETITINSLAPQTYTTDCFYALGDTLEYPINYTIEEEKTIEKGLSKVKWTINFTNTLSEVANYTYRVYLPFEADNVTLDGSPVDVTLDTFGKYIDIDLNLDVSESETHTIEFSVLPVSIDISPPKYPLRFWVGQYANIIIDILVKNLATVSVNQTSVKIDIPYGENVTVYLEGYEVDRVDLVKGYYELNITNLTAGEARSYQIIFKSPTAEAIAGKYSGRRIINGTQYLMYPIYVKSVATFPLTNLSMRLEVSDPFKCYDLKFCWLTDKDTYLNPPKGEELDLDCEDSKTAILDIGELSVGGEKYITCFLREKERPAPVLPDIYNFFDWLINAIKNFINWLIGLFK